jgi:hypothetical protein
MTRSLQCIGRVLCAPRAAFAAIREEPHWGWFFLLAVVASALLLLLSTPFIEHAYGYTSGTSASVSAAASISATLLIPPTLLLKWLFYSVPLFLLARPMAGGYFAFRQIYAAVAHAESVPVLANAANLFLLHARGVDAIAAPEDLTAVPGLGRIFQGYLDNPALISILDQFTVFQLWYVVLLTIGLAVTARCSWWTALALAGGMWLLGAVLQAALGVLAGGA